MQTQLTFQCPHCDQDLLATEEHAGHSFDCPSCANMFTVPANHALALVKQPVIVPEIVEYDDRPHVPARRRKRRDNQMVPVRMKIPGLPGAEFEGAVDQKTSNAMATTFLGGLLVALGAIVVFMLGGKGRSA